MKNLNYKIRPMSRNELDILIVWAEQEGWRSGLHDAHCYHAADPEGFLIGLLDDEPIAAISAVKYANHFGFLGFYIVKPEFRGKGFGMQVWTAGMNYLEGLNIGLDGVVAQQDNYKKSGFKLAYRNIRYEGSGGGKAPDGSDIVELSSLPFDVIDLYEKEFFPANRTQFTRIWIAQADSHASGVMQHGKLAGYGAIRNVPAVSRD